MSFWDASALVPLIVDEPRSAGLRRLAGSDRAMALWWAAPVECASAMCRLVREGRLTARDRQSALALLDDLSAAAVQVQPSEEIRVRARRLLAVHPLRASDALQLAAALTWCRDRPARSTFVCLDDRLRAAAGAEGFDLLPQDPAGR
jgi:predicted nucleic acid-binding protein